MCHLWEAWAKEEGHAEADINAYARRLLAGIVDGSVVTLVAYRDDEPVGMAVVDVAIEPGHGRVRAFADKLYVLPEFRGLGILHEIAEGLAQIGRDVDAHEEVLSCQVGSFLQEFYEGWGFKATDVVMRRFL